MILSTIVDTMEKSCIVLTKLTPVCVCSMKNVQPIPSVLCYMSTQYSFILRHSDQVGKR